MTDPSPQAPDVWFLDRETSQPMLDDMSRHVAQHLPEARVRTFTNALKAREAIEAQKGVRPDKRPLFFITDNPGTQSMAGGKALVDFVHEVNPFAMVIYYSHRLDDDPNRIQELKRSRRIQEGISKTEPVEKLMNLLSCWRDRGDHPAARRLLDHILQGLEPGTKFYPDDNGNLLSIIDLYQEVVAGTPLGLMVEQLIDSLPGEALLTHEGA